MDPVQYELGYTDEQLESIQKHAVHQVVAKLLDNPNLGQPSEQLKDWVTQEGSSLFREELMEASFRDSAQFFRIYDVYAGSYSTSPPAVYDGGTRFTQISIDVVSINIRKADNDEDTSAANDAEVTLNTSSTIRTNSAEYDEWKTALLTNMGYSDYVSQVKDEPFDRDAPALLDVQKEFKIGYNAEDIQSGGELKIRSISTHIEELINAIPYNS